MATYASLITLEQNIQEHIRESDDLNPLREKVVELKNRCSQATLPSEDVKLKIRGYAYRASNIIEDLYLQPLHRTRDELRKLDEEASRLVDEARTFMDATDHPSMESKEQKQVPLKLEGLETLLGRLYDHSQRQLEVIVIHGMGGSGKTTIANHLFERQRTRDHFDCQAWITAPQNFDRRNYDDKCTLLSQILRDLKEQPPEEVSLQDLRQKVHQTLIRRRYLIVIDNVWDNNGFWDFIQHLLRDDAKASRVLLTTRDDVAAYFVTSTCEIYFHKVKELDEGQSWTLLKEKVFGNDKDCPDELENSGKSIAKGCGGLPLCIVVIAEVLKGTDMKKDSWENVARDVSGAIRIGSDGQVEKILGLSYTKLPHHLKPCFLYLACFPKGDKIEVSKLIMLWVAERFLKLESPERSPEEVAYNYLDNLVKKNLVMVSKMNDDDKIELCYLHDQIRSMCVEKAKEENFVCEFYGDRILSSDEIENKIRFSIYSKNFVTDYQHRDKQILRSTHYFPDLCQVPLMSCTHLQVLDAGGILFPEFPEQVCQLHLLKYLALRINEDFEVSVVKFPPCITNLRNLQVFRVEGFERLTIELPLEIWEMSKLRHLTFFGESKATIPDPPAGTSSFLKNLQTMWSLVDFKFTEEVRIRIPEVKELGIEYNDEEDRYCLRDLDQLESLETLRIRNGIPSQNIKLPDKLKHLTLSWCRFPWSKMGEVVGSLRNLEVLKLKDNTCVGDEWEVKGGEFPQLRVLEIDETELRVWKGDDEEANIFPSLVLLKLYKCKYLKDFPSGIGRIHTLKHIKVDEILRNWASEVVKDKKDNGYGDVEMR